MTDTYSTLYDAILFEERTKEVMELLLKGSDYREIVLTLQPKYPGTTYQDIAECTKYALKYWKEQQYRATDEFVALDLARLDTLLAAWWDVARKGDTKNIFAVDRILSIIEQRQKLYEYARKIGKEDKENQIPGHIVFKHGKFKTEIKTTMEDEDGGGDPASE